MTFDGLESLPISPFNAAFASDSLSRDITPAENWLELRSAERGGRGGGVDFDAIAAFDGGNPWRPYNDELEEIAPEFSSKPVLSVSRLEYDALPRGVGVTEGAASALIAMYTASDDLF